MLNTTNQGGTDHHSTSSDNDTMNETQMTSGGSEAGSMMSGEMMIPECIEEICDALDNDCDGKVDEGALCSCDLDNSCYGGPFSLRGIGVCQDGTRECDSNGEVWGECTGWIGPSSEVCDELDNDCDGRIDESEQSECSICEENTTELCDGIDNDCDGTIDENVDPNTAPDELCDGMDNDCDGRVDEAVIDATEEVCDGIDNDCDGTVDEAVVDATEEVCDGIDNDCDGTIDESLTRECDCNVNNSNLSTCENGVWTDCIPISTETTMIQIPSIGPGCRWNQNGNIDHINGAVTARIEQEVPFNLPVQASLCSLSILGVTPNFYYDDHLMLLLNQVPLIGSLNFASQFEVVNGLPRYDWSRIVGQRHNQLGDQATCLAGATTCVIPGTQTNGMLDLAFDEMTNLLLSRTSLTNEHLFTLVVTGDNDPDVDCFHSGFTMQITYDYLDRN